MQDAVITVENLSKSYLLGHNTGGGMRGTKKLGTPNIRILAAQAWLSAWRV